MITNKKYFIIFFVSFFIQLNIYTQQDLSFEDFKKQRDEEFSQFVKEREEYIQKMDEEFAVYLRQQWQEFNTFEGLKVNQKIKPVTQPTYTNVTSIPTAITTESITTKETIKEKELPLLQKEEAENFPKQTIRLFFYGTPVQLELDIQFIKLINTPVNEEVISSYWEKMNKTNYNHFINQLINYKTKLNLNDWGFYLLLKKATEQITPSSLNAQSFLQWFLLIKSNYIAKLGYKDNVLYVMIPSKQEMYDIPFLTVNQSKYYIVNPKKENKENIFTYQKDFSEAKRILDLNIFEPIYLMYSNKETTYTLEGKQITIKYNQNIIDFYKDYPISNIKTYLDATISAVTRESVKEAIQPLLEGKTEKEAVSILLRFVQSFNYQTDQQQFGKEKFFFAEELFAYPASDCEDRSVLFAYLVKDLLGLEVLGLEYPEHFATAIKLKTAIEGDQVNYKNRKYIVCDPTYKNAPIGKIQPKFKDAKAKIIVPDNDQYYATLSNKIWQKINSAGGNHGSNGGDIVFDNENNAYVTGYFIGNLELGKTKLISIDSTNDIFLAKFNSSGEVIWLKSFGGKGIDIAYNICIVDDQYLYYTGSFNRSIDFGSKNIETKSADAFVVKCDKDGIVLWANKVGIDSLNHQNNILFVSQFSKEGKQNSIRVYDESENFEDFGLSQDINGNIVLVGGLWSTPGLRLKTMLYTNYAEFNPVTELKVENDKLIAKQYHPSVAGIFAIINLINTSEIPIPGKIAQQALDKYNPSFKKLYSSIYENIGKIEFLRNSKGIIIIRTNNGGSVNFSNMKIDNDAKIKVFSYNSGNAQVDILSGISVGKAFIWYSLNFIKIQKQGELMFDYDINHSQKKMNMKEILN